MRNKIKSKIIKRKKAVNKGYNYSSRKTISLLKQENCWTVSYPEFKGRLEAPTYSLKNYILANLRTRDSPKTLRCMFLLFSPSPKEDHNISQKKDIQKATMTFFFYYLQKKQIKLDKVITTRRDSNK